MKIFVSTIFAASLVTYLTLGLQATLYVLPFPAPALWVVVFCFISFFRPFPTAMVFNVFLCLIMAQFTVVNLAPLMLILNIHSFFIKSIQNRFHLNQNQICLSIGIFSFSISLSLYLLQGPSAYEPQWFGWLGQTLSTGLLAPLLFYPLIRLDTLLPGDPLDSLELYV